MDKAFGIEMRKRMETEICFSPVIGGGKRAWVPKEIVSLILIKLFDSLSKWGKADCINATHMSWEFDTEKYNIVCAHFNGTFHHIPHFEETTDPNFGNQNIPDR